MTKNCTNCAWFCHADGKCYGTEFILDGTEIGATIMGDLADGCCLDWAFDGLKDEEREALVTMEQIYG